MDSFQGLIHRLEVGGGMRYLRIGLSVLAVLLFLVLYDWRSYRNMGTQEAMDSAQLARNLAEGKGYKTYFIRPFSLYLVGKRNQEKFGVAQPGQAPDYQQIKGLHPDIINPPLYPAVLAGLIKVGHILEKVPFLNALSFNFPVETSKPFWSQNGQFWRYQPDFLIAAFNQVLLFLVILSVFFLARRLFEPRVAWMAGGVVLGTELLWRFSVSGLSTMLLLLVFSGLAWCIVLLEEETREPKWHPVGLFALSAAAGLLVAVGGLTRYSFVFMLLPVLVFILLTTGRQRWVYGATALVACGIVLGPWLIRNYSISGQPFGMASYVVLQGSQAFPEDRLERSLEPNLQLAMIHKLNIARLKLMANSRQIVQEDLPKLSGGWISAFFMVGLLAPFKNPAIRRLRYFVVGSLAVLVVVQALGRTQLSEVVPEVSSENLLVLLAPLVVVYGVSFFYFLFDQIYFPFRELRYGALGVFAAVACLPLILTFLPPKIVPVVFPSYYPPTIQKVASWTKENELMMSDVPWAVAWYGQRPCVWQTLNVKDDFYQIYDYMRPISVLYLASLPQDKNVFPSLYERNGWGALVMQTTMLGRGPDGFPLRAAKLLAPQPQAVFSDWERWRVSSD